MTKCDFCVYSHPDGTCHWVKQSNREPYCKHAIKIMVKCLGKEKNND